MLHRKVRVASTNTTQLHGNKRKQLELAKVINAIQVVFVWFCIIQIYLNLLCHKRSPVTILLTALNILLLDEVIESFLNDKYTLKFRNGYNIYLITIFFNRTLIIISDDNKVGAF